MSRGASLLGSQRSFMPKWSPGRAAYGKSLENEEFHSGLGAIYHCEAKEGSAEPLPEVCFLPWMWLIVRKQKGAEFISNFCKSGWGRQWNRKFKSWWNLVEAQSFCQPMPDMPQKQKHHLCVFSEPPADLILGSRKNKLKPLSLQYQGLGEAAPAQLLAICFPLPPAAAASSLAPFFHPASILHCWNSKCSVELKLKAETC